MVCGRSRGGRGAGMRGMRSEDLYMVLYPFGLFVRMILVERRTYCLKASGVDPWSATAAGPSVSGSEEAEPSLRCLWVPRA
jgi:hypothetical protein